MSDNQAVVAINTNPVSQWTEDQKALIKRQIAVNSTDDELALFLAFCANQNFDPFAKDVYFVKRKSNQSPSGFSTAFQTSIDAMRSRAEETGNYAGNDKPVYHYNEKRELTLVEFTVYKTVKGVRCPFYGEAAWDEFYPGDAQGMMWKKMPRNQLRKCAEAQALRMAFPKQLKKLYIKEEMEQADKIEVVEGVVEGERLSNESLTALLKSSNTAVVDTRPQEVIVPIPQFEEPPRPAEKVEAKVFPIKSGSNFGSRIIKVSKKFFDMKIEEVSKNDLQFLIGVYSKYKHRTTEMQAFLEDACGYLGTSVPGIPN